MSKLIEDISADTVNGKTERITRILVLILPCTLSKRLIKYLNLLLSTNVKERSYFIHSDSEIHLKMRKPDVEFEK